LFVVVVLFFSGGESCDGDLPFTFRNISRKIAGMLLDLNSPILVSKSVAMRSLWECAE